jgi:hypothetical protein
MEEVKKTFLKSIDNLSNIYFILWLVRQFLIYNSYNLTDLPVFIGTMFITDYVALFCLAVILFLPSSAYSNKPEGA